MTNIRNNAVIPVVIIPITGKVHLRVSKGTTIEGESCTNLHKVIEPRPVPGSGAVALITPIASKMDGDSGWGITPEGERFFFHLVNYRAEQFRRAINHVQKFID